jgi:hypothetical protein
MKYKIAIVNNKVRKRDIEDAQEWLQEFIDKRTPIEVDFHYYETNKEVRLKEFKKNSKGREVWGTVNGKDIVRDLLVDNNYHQVIFCYDSEPTGFKKDETKYLTAWSFWNELYVGTEYTEVPMGKLHRDKWEETTWSHETMHAFVKRVNRSGRQIKDHMDETIVNGKVVEYYNNDDPYAKEGNYSRTLRSLDGYWDVVTSSERNDKFNEILGKVIEAQKELNNKVKKVDLPDGYMENPEYIVFHHGADARTLNFSEALDIYQETHYETLYKAYNQPRDEGVYHRDVAYHRIAAPDRWGQVRSDALYSYHASNLEVNKNSIAVCITGNMSKDTPSKQHEKNIIEMVQDVKKRHPSIKHVALHRDFADKECAGLNITHDVINTWWRGEMYFNKEKELPQVSPAIQELAGVLNKHEELEEFRGLFVAHLQKKLLELRNQL